MAATGQVAPIAERSASPQEVWDRAVLQNGGHLLQGWNWGEFKRRHGWQVERVYIERAGSSACGSVLFKHSGPFSIAYIPRGPSAPVANEDISIDLMLEIDRVCQARRALHLIIEPDKTLPVRSIEGNLSFIDGPPPFQPARTVKVPLLEDDALLKQMHQKTRYSVRLAQRRGVEVEQCQPTEHNVDIFFGLLQDTSERNEFGIHMRRYYSDFLEIFADDALMLLARVEGQVAAGLVAARYGEEAIYMYGGSSSEHRAHGAAFLLQFEAMKWARESGCVRYDLWGIPEDDPSSASEQGDRIAGTKGEDWRGLYRFKTGFGGDIVTYPPTLERRYRPLLSSLARRRYGNRV
jgi:lipid II:glycine glycyltransferase (peptidoglycan interpeptide bridge formation enzyme)